MTDETVNLREKQYPECGWLQHFSDLAPEVPHSWTLSSPGAQAELDRQPDGSCQLSLKWTLGPAANYRSVIARAKTLSTTIGTHVIRSIAGFFGDSMDEIRCTALLEAGFRRIGVVQLNSRESTGTASQDNQPVGGRMALTCSLDSDGQIRWNDGLHHPEIAEFLTDVFRNSPDISIPVLRHQPPAPDPQIAAGSRMIIHAGLLSRTCYVRLILNNNARHSIVGAAILQSDGWLSCLGVAAGQRRRRIATRLLDGQWSDDLRAITCAVDPQNLPAVEFYRAVGFQIQDSAPLFAWQKAATE